MFRMTDEKGPDDKIIAVPAHDPRLEHLQDLRHLPEFERLEIQHFFEVYKDLEPGKSVEGATWAGREAAELEIEEARKRAATQHAAEQRAVAASRAPAVAGAAMLRLASNLRGQPDSQVHVPGLLHGLNEVLGKQVVAGRSQVHAVGVADLLERPVDHRGTG